MKAVGLGIYISFYLARFILKRKILFVLLVVVLAATASAQGWERGGRNPRLPAPETVTVSGSLIVAHGFPALKSGDVTYIVGGINRLAGFVDGLKEGAQVIIEGIAMASPRSETFKFLRPMKLTLNGKVYDLALPAPPPRTGANKAPEGKFEHRKGAPGPRALQRQQRQHRQFS